MPPQPKPRRRPGYEPPRVHHMRYDGVILDPRGDPVVVDDPEELRRIARINARAAERFTLNGQGGEEEQRPSAITQLDSKIPTPPSPAKRPAAETTLPVVPESLTIPVQDKKRKLIPKHAVNVTSNEIRQINDVAEFKAALEWTERDPSNVFVVFLYAHATFTPCKAILTRFQQILDTYSTSESHPELNLTEADADSESKQPEPAADPSAFETASKSNLDQTLTLAFYTVDMDTGPTSMTQNGKAPIYVTYRQGKKLFKIATEGEGLEWQ
ncbi:hypothetical protein HDU98_005103, partial [Podochytrium sp. JEL0797]